LLGILGLIEFGLITLGLQRRAVSADRKAIAAMTAEVLHRAER
jgi:hypothetical protein